MILKEFTAGNAKASNYCVLWGKVQRERSRESKLRVDGTQGPAKSTPKQNFAELLATFLDLKVPCGFSNQVRLDLPAAVTRMPRTTHSTIKTYPIKTTHHWCQNTSQHFSTFLSNDQ
jgi:hypothetical protein